jgi:hypothetical protein
MAQDNIKMLVLETDETHPETMKNQGGFGDLFRELFDNAGRKHEPPLHIDIDMHFVVDDPVSCYPESLRSNH